MSASVVGFFLCEIGAVVLSNVMTPGVRGPGFLLYYFFLWFILLGIAKWNDWHVILPIIIYLSAGIARYLEGREHGMSHFGFLWFMMGVGGVIYLVQAAEITSGGSSSGGCSSIGGCGGGSSGCGSSGCGGGGGCGGCGGD